MEKYDFKSFLLKFVVTCFGLAAISLVVSSCSPEADEDVEDCMSSGDILVSNSGSDAVMVLKSDGTYKGIAVNFNNNSESPFGLAWMSGNEEFMVAVDGADRVIAVKKTDCTSRTLIADANLTGNLRGITQVSDGDILIVETSSIERFDSTGLRINTAGWPLTLQTTGTQLAANGTGFIHCSTGSDVVRTYNNAGTQQATRSSGIAATTDAVGCVVLADGNIAVAWSGTTDTVAIYNSTLTTVVATFSDLGVLANPGGIAQRANGNILVIDRVFNYIVELTSAGVYVGVIADGVLSTPEFLTVVP